MTIVNRVTADYAKKERLLASGDDVHQDEVIEVSKEGQGELKLDDDTKVALAGGARLVLDKFVYDSDKKSGSIAIEFAKGALRFITGIASKPTYVINTPNASITVRGTIFDVFILPNNDEWILLHEGALEVTGKKSKCQVLDEPGKLIKVTSAGDVGRPVNWSKLKDRDAVTFETAFPFVVDPPQIDANPVLTQAAIETASSPDEQEKTCINPHRPTIKIKKANTGNGGKKKVRHAKTVKRKKDRKADAATKAAIGISIGIGLGALNNHHHHSERSPKGRMNYP